MLPSVSINKVAANIGSSRASNVGILAIVAASQQGPQNVPTGTARTDLALTTFGNGPLVEDAALFIDIAGQSCVLIRPTTAVPGSYGTLVHTGVVGTCVPSNGGTTPLDHYNVLVEVVAGGTIGVTGITYQYSLDGGQTMSGIQALGTASTLTIPNSGVSFALAAGTLLANDFWTVPTERPQPNDSDLPASFTALQNSALPWEGVYIDSVFDSSTVGLVDAWLAGLEAKGQFKFAILNTRFKTEPQPTAETEGAYATAMQTLTGSSASIRIGVGADGGHVASPITGFNIKRPAGFLAATWALKWPIGTDAAYVALGNLPDVQLSDNAGNPLDHDENNFPDLDNLRLITLRSFSADGPEGIYVTNPNILQPSGDDFPYLQMVRIMNRACTVAWAQLTKQLSVGVAKNPKPDPVTGAITILEPDAARIEQFVNGPMQQAVKGQVSSALFSLSRTDDLSVTPVVVTGTISIVTKAYIKGYQVQAEFSKTIQVAA